MLTPCRFAFILMALTSPLCVSAHRGSRFSAHVSHRFGDKHAQVVWNGGRRDRSQDFLETDGGDAREAQQIRIMHVTDNHISVLDDLKPRSTRMFNAFAHTTDRSTDAPTSPQEEFRSLLQKARQDKVDLIALGGDLVNYPSEATVAWVLEQLKEEAPGIPFVYTAGNHDWHLEGDRGRPYDASREEQLNATLRPLFDASAASADAVHGPGAGQLYGHAWIKGVDVIFIDNSNHQVNDEQLAFARSQLANAERAGNPAVLLLHMPLQLPGVDLEPKYVCGHPDWGAQTDENWEIESRSPWPEGNAKPTGEFIALVQSHSAPAGRLTSILTGHVHRDFSVPTGGSLPKGIVANSTSLACVVGQKRCGMAVLSFDSSTDVSDDHFTHEAMGALQYNTADGAEGGYRMFTMHLGAPAM